MNISKSSLVALVGMGLIWSLVAAADDPQAAETTPPTDAKSPKDKADTKKDKKDQKDKKDFPDFKDVVTDEFKTIQVYGDPDLAPFYKLYYNKKTDELFAEIPSSKFGQNVMLSSTIHSAPGLAGWMWGDQFVRWERRNKQLLLIQPDPRY